ncbi:unnamed protein product [Aureobasidium vineae]|uniref:Myb-like domain-containing protein n=1 Tax=Aureobasidium vineae TaxID=2773715 RepID=A0A9N8JW62_9PEZI|nr:unnamed protein product [Aureobasidium vineae]
MAFDDYLRARSSSRDDANSYDPDEYQRGRQRIDLKLKGTFERIFEKYARDFTGVGDEIDMETGEVVVDNGHLTYMQHERDTGKSASSRFVRAFADELEVEDGDDNEDDGDDGPHQEPEGEEDELHQDPDDDEDELQHEPRQENDQEEDYLGREEEDLSDDEDGDYEDAAVEAGDEQSGDESDDLGHGPEHFALDPRLAEPDAMVSQEQQYHSTPVIPSTEISHSLPQISIADSLNQLVPHQDANGRVDPEAIHQLGQSIANQIAQFLMHATSINRQPSQGIWSAPPLPQDAFSPPSFFDNRRAAITPAPHRAPSVWDSPSGGQSLWAPAASRPKKRRRLLKHTETSFGIDPALTDDAAFSDAPSRNRYSREEDELIKRLKEINGLTWQEITRRLPGRTTGGLSGRYTRVLKDLPRPVMIKREIIEIMDGDDDELSTPGPSHVATSPGMSPFQTPLLRRAMDKQIARHGDNGELPITIGIEDDTDSRDSSAPLPDTSKKKRKAKDKDPSLGLKGQYRTFDSSNPAGNFGVLCTDSPAPFTAEEHNLNFYGPTSGFGVLRLEKPSKGSKRPPNKPDPPRDAFRNATRFNHPAPQLRNGVASTSTSTVNLFARAEQHMRSKGFNAASMAISQLRLLSSLQGNQRSNPTIARSSNAGGPMTMMPPSSARPRAEPALEGSSPLPTHPPPPYSANPPSRASTPPRLHTPLTRRTEPMAIDTENDGDVSDSSMDTPATAKRYANAPNITSNTNGPYFLSNLPPPPSPLVTVPQAQSRSPSSSPLSSPLSSPPPMPSPTSSQASSAKDRRRSTRSTTRQATKNSLLPPGPGEVARMNLPTPSTSLRKSISTPSAALTKGKSTFTPKTAALPRTPMTRYGTPVRETVGRKEMLMKKAMPEPDDGSEDELA